MLGASRLEQRSPGSLRLARARRSQGPVLPRRVDRLPYRGWRCRLTRGRSVGPRAQDEARGDRRIAWMSVRGGDEAVGARGTV